MQEQDNKIGEEMTYRSVQHLSIDIQSQEINGYMYVSLTIIGRVVTTYVRNNLHIIIMYRIYLKLIAHMFANHTFSEFTA